MTYHFLFITGNLTVTSIKQCAAAVTYYEISNGLPDISNYMLRFFTQFQQNSLTGDRYLNCITYYM